MGSHSQITHHGDRESCDGSVGAVSKTSLSHSVRFNGDDENKQGTFVCSFLPFSTYIP